MIVKEFYKMQASGNDFILVDHRPSTIDYRLKRGRINYKQVAKKFCERKFGVGADGLLVIEASKKADFKMRIFNSDGSEAQMCGNGARCVALWAKIDQRRKTDDGRQKTEDRGRKLGCRFETVAGIIEAEVTNVKDGSGNAKIKMADVFGMSLSKPLKVCSKTINVNYLNTGVPHVVVFVQGLEAIDVDKIGAAIRFHETFAPAGTNVNFVEVLKNNLIKIRTYERGVEAETLACGTGSAACAIISGYKLADEALLCDGEYKMNVSTRSGETLGVYFNCKNNKINDVWLEGKAYLVYQGQVC
ncbi:MAG: diaminopimelate epimerase [Candidatus Omnitrophota bacterium]|nr:diaminopimelate epimerase [Candidatus Omnitrophota bacterium]